MNARIAKPKPAGPRPIKSRDHKMNQVIVISNVETGEVKLRVPQCTVRQDGSLWHQNQTPIIVTLNEPEERKDDLKRKYQVALAEKNYDAIAPEHFARLGLEGKVLVEWERDYQARLDAERSNRIMEPFFGVAKNGAPFIALDVRQQIQGSEVTFRGVTFGVVTEGKSYSAGAHTVRRCYIKTSSWRITPEARRPDWLTMANDDAERWQHAFDRMMEDEHNDGVNPPAPQCKMLWEIADALKESERDRDRRITVTLSTRGWGDYPSLTWSGSSKTPAETYLAEARKLLEAGHDVDRRNQTDVEILTSFQAAVDKV